MTLHKLWQKRSEMQVKRTQLVADERYVTFPVMLASEPITMMCVDFHSTLPSVANYYSYDPAFGGIAVRDLHPYFTSTAAHDFRSALGLVTLGYTDGAQKAEVLNAHTGIRSKRDALEAVRYLKAGGTPNNMLHAHDWLSVLECRRRAHDVGIKLRTGPLYFMFTTIASLDSLRYSYTEHYL